MSLLLRMSFLPWQNLLIITFSYTFQTNANKGNLDEFWLGIISYGFLLKQWLNCFGYIPFLRWKPKTLCHTRRQMHSLRWRCRVIMSTKCQKYYGEMLCLCVTEEYDALCASYCVIFIIVLLFVAANASAYD